MQKLNSRSSIDKVHNAAIADLRRYSKYKYFNDRPLGIIKDGVDDITNFVINNCKQIEENRFVLQKQFIRDVLHIREPGNYGGIVIEDSILLSSYAKDFNAFIHKHNLKYNRTVPIMDFLAHRDAIQLIPRGARYAGSILDGVTIADMDISSTGHLQPIFASDGLFTDLHIKDNIINTKSAHDITIGGMLSGSITDNTGADGETIIPELRPLRLGGGKLNIMVISFATSSSQQYRVIKGAVNDRRTIPVKGVPYVDLLNYDRFIKLYNARKYQNMDRFIRIDQVLKIMHGEKTCIYSKSQSPHR